jgi:hypothetical protein
MHKIIITSKAVKDRKNKIEPVRQNYITSTNLDEYIKKIEKELEDEKRKKINNYIYQYIITRYTSRDIKEAFSNFQTFCNFIDDIVDNVQDNLHLF